MLYLGDWVDIMALGTDSDELGLGLQWTIGELSLCEDSSLRHPIVPMRRFRQLGRPIIPTMFVSSRCCGIIVVLKTDSLRINKELK